MNALGDEDGLGVQDLERGRGISNGRRLTSVYVDTST